jgi:sugar phosphate isomerase/epimerase
MVGSGPDRWQSLDGVREVAAEFQAAAEVARPHALRLCCHNHWWEMQEFDGQIAYDVFMAEAPDVFGELDVYWASNFERIDVPKLVTKYASRLPLLHIKNGPLVKDRKHTAVGAGKMDIPAVIAAADQTVLEWLIVEIDACEGDMMTAVRESYDYLVGNGLAKGSR